MSFCLPASSMHSILKTVSSWMLCKAAGPSPFIFRRSLSDACVPAQRVECAVIGAGVIGLAVARSLALAGREVVILDSNLSFGSETSSRNSEVIHAGLYYPFNSLKSSMCIEGNAALYDFCRQRSIPHKNTGKLVVASNKEQLAPLRALHSWAQECGVRGLELLSREEALSLEPNLSCEAALLSHSSGILDSHTYMATLLADAEAAGSVLAVASKVRRGKVLDRPNRVFSRAGGDNFSNVHDDASGRSRATETGCTLENGGTGSEEVRGNLSGSNVPDARNCQPEGRRGCSRGGGGGIMLEVEDLQSNEVMELHADMVVNTAGLQAQSLSKSIEGIPPTTIPPLYLAKGNYFTLAGGGVSSAAQGKPAGTDASEYGPSQNKKPPQLLFSRLIYPMPPASGGGLGIHLTLDMAGGLRFGPDVEHVQHIDYTVDQGRALAFEQAIRSYWPGLPSNALVPGYAGIRPKLSAPGQPASDFVVQGPETHSIRGLVCLYGIESPGLTASLVLAEHVARMLHQSSA